MYVVLVVSSVVCMANNIYQVCIIYTWYIYNIYIYIPGIIYKVYIYCYEYICFEAEDDVTHLYLVKS